MMFDGGCIFVIFVLDSFGILAFFANDSFEDLCTTYRSYLAAVSGPAPFFGERIVFDLNFSTYYVLLNMRDFTSLRASLKDDICWVLLKLSFLLSCGGLTMLLDVWSSFEPLIS